MEKFLSKRTSSKIIKSFMTLALMAALILTGLGIDSSVITAQASTAYTTLYFVDNTAEHWVDNDNAVMELVDNTNGQVSYIMGQVNSTTWKAEVPVSTNNVTFNRYDANRTTKWNSWSAGGRDNKNAYFAQGHEYGSWGIIEDEIQSAAEYRIELTWGSEPADLDSHLSYYNNGNRLMHVYYGNRTGSVNGQNIANLDTDDMSSYGPETVTVSVTSQLLNGGIFKYSVQDFTNKNSTSSNKLSMSGAVVRVYKGNDLVVTFNVPKNNVGTVWHVFEITENGIVSINEFENISDVSSVN